MKIIDLKEKHPLVYEAALKNQEIIGNSRNDQIDIDAYVSSGGFNWNTCPERGSFWLRVSNRDFDQAFKICPHLKTPEKWVPKRGDGVMCSTNIIFKALLDTASINGYDVYKPVLTTPNCFVYNGHEFIGCMPEHIKNHITPNQFISLVTGKSGGVPQPWIPKVGDKVKIPKTKSVGQKLNECNHIKRAAGNNQPFLYVIDIVKNNPVEQNKDTITLSWSSNPRIGGNYYYLLSDLEPYEEIIDQSVSLQSTLNSTNNNQNEQRNKSSKIIKTDRLISETRSGEKPGGNPIRGRTRTATVESRPISYSASIIKC